MKPFLVILISIITISCSTPTVYKPNSSFTFLVKVTNQNKNDTINLFVTDESWLIVQTKCIWKYPPIIDSLGSISYITGTTGIVDWNYPFPFNLLFPSQIWIHPPRQLYLRMAQMVPFPKVMLPIEKGQVIPWELTPKKGWEELEGKTVTGHIVVTDKIFFDNPVVNDWCWVLETIGESEIGNFNSKYYFHEKYGFVYLYYDFNEYQVEMSLIDAKLP